MNHEAQTASGVVQAPELPNVRRGRREAGDALAASPAVLLTDVQAARLLGIGRSLFHKLRSTGADWLPTPVQISPRVVRYSRREIEDCVARMPRLIEHSEPVSLRRARIERLKEGR
jgi:predicted DNA-binding transcriptional regulator AlpA